MGSSATPSSSGRSCSSWSASRMLPLRNTSRSRIFHRSTAIRVASRSSGETTLAPWASTTASRTGSPTKAAETRHTVSMTRNATSIPSARSRGSSAGLRKGTRYGRELTAAANGVEALALVVPIELSIVRELEQPAAAIGKAREEQIRREVAGYLPRWRLWERGVIAVTNCPAHRGIDGRADCGEVASCPLGCRIPRVSNHGVDGGQNCLDLFKDILRSRTRPDDGYQRHRMDFGHYGRHLARAPHAVRCQNRRRRCRRGRSQRSL